MKTNVTLKLDADLLREARVVAAEEGRSISALLTDRLEAGEGSAGKLLGDPALFNNADQMLVETRQLVKSIRENPKKYLTIHFRVF